MDVKRRCQQAMCGLVLNQLVRLGNIKAMCEIANLEMTVRFRP